MIQSRSKSQKCKMVGMLAETEWQSSSGTGANGEQEAFSLTGTGTKTRRIEGNDKGMWSWVLELSDFMALDCNNVGASHQ